MAAASYLALAVMLLWPSIGPGRTLVPTDIVAAVEPYASLDHDGPPANAILSDATFQFFPWYRFVATHLREGVIPRWNPDILGGVPVTPNGFVNVYYPPFWLAAVLSTYDAYNLFVVGHLALGAAGIYAFSRVLGARFVASWTAGVAALGAAMWVHWSTH
ncbi:MAG: hypothetical protein ACRD0D_11325, partial [Acidimicrobiales bacterium]